VIGWPVRRVTDHPPFAVVHWGFTLDSERCGEPYYTNRSHDERSAIPDMLDPLVIESMSKNGGADRAGQMRPALAPVETGTAEHSSR
jgi:hypothetical protein